MGWDEERIAKLKELWSEGLSASQIARQLGGVTRNAVIGKIHRLGLQARSSPIRPAVRPPAPVRRRAVVAARPGRVGSADVPKLVEPEPAASGPENAFPADPPEMARACRWITGDPAKGPWKTCGAAVVPGTSWCKHHAIKAVNPHQPKMRPGGYRETYIPKFMTI